MTSVPPTQPPAAPKTETDANGLTEAEQEALYATFRPGHHVDWSKVDPKFADLTTVVERIVAERVRVVESERDALRIDLATCERIANGIEDRAESAEAAHRALQAAVEDLPNLTQGPHRAGTALWPECDRDAYSLAIEEAQAALRALVGGAR